MDRPDFATMYIALYQVSKEMIFQIITQKDKMIDQLRGTMTAIERSKNQKIHELQQRLANLEREKNIRIMELQQQNYALKQQVIGFEERIRNQGSIKKIQEQREQSILLEKAFIQKANKWSNLNGVVNIWQDLKKMQAINIGEGGMEKLPQKVFQLTQLKKLYLYQNKLRDIPEVIGSLKGLTYLNISHNQLTELPQSLGALNQLQQLWASSNKLSRLPESICNLTQLQKIILSQNQITQLPTNLCNLKNMIWLSIRDNKLKYLPLNLRFMSKLELLYIYRNELIQLPKDIQTLSEIAFIGLDLYLISGFNIFVSNPINSLNKLKQLILCFTNAEQNRIDVIKQECKERRIQLTLNDVKENLYL